MRKIENNELNRLSVEEFSQAPKTPIIVILDNVRSLNNVGSIFRSGDAFAIEEIILCGITATPPNKEIHKTALGAELSVKWSYVKDTVDAVNSVKNRGYSAIAVEQVENAIMLDKFNNTEIDKYAIILGNEVDGVSQSVVNLCDNYIEIPQIGTKHSLNVSVAAGIVLWHLFSRS